MPRAPLAGSRNGKSTTSLFTLLLFSYVFYNGCLFQICYKLNACTLSKNQEAQDLPKESYQIYQPKSTWSS